MPNMPEAERGLSWLEAQPDFQLIDYRDIA